MTDVHLQTSPECNLARALGMRAVDIKSNYHIFGRCSLSIPQVKLLIF